MFKTLFNLIILFIEASCFLISSWLLWFSSATIIAKLHWTLAIVTISSGEAAMSMPLSVILAIFGLIIMSRLWTKILFDRLKFE